MVLPFAFDEEHDGAGRTDAQDAAPAGAGSSQGAVPEDPHEDQFSNPAGQLCSKVEHQGQRQEQQAQTWRWMPRHLGDHEMKKKA